MQVPMSILLVYNPNRENIILFMLNYGSCLFDINHIKSTTSFMLTLASILPFADVFFHINTS